MSHLSDFQQKLVILATIAAAILAFPSKANSQTSSQMEVARTGVTIPFPEGWSENHVANLHRLLYASPEKVASLSAPDREELPQINVTVIAGKDHAEALRRLQEIAAEWNAPPTYLSIANWPALQRRVLIVKPVEADDVSQSDRPEMQVLVTTAIAAGNQLVRLDGIAPEDAPAQLIEQMFSISRGVTLREGGDARQTNPEVETLRHATPLKTPPPLDQTQSLQPNASYITPPKRFKFIPSGAGASFINTQLGSEPEIAVSTDGKNIVIAAGFRFSSSQDGGLTFPTRNVSMPNTTGGDSSVAFGKSGNFYEASIASTSACPAANPSCNNATGINISAAPNNGKAFTFLTNAFVCGTCGFGGVPDQEHIAADRFTSSSSGKDRVYSVWRKGSGYGLVCSSDSGATWSAPTFVTTGSTDFPRITVGGDSTVYVVTQNGGNIVLDSYGTCDSGLNPIVKQAVIATGVSVVTCPVAGLDRCNNGNNLSSWTVAVDDTNSAHVYVAYSVNTSAGVNENVLVQDSNDSGATWTRPSVQVSTNTNGRRFMPWVCSVGGSAFVSWYDRRNATSTSNDLTDYFANNALLSSGNLVAGTEFQVNSPGTPDPQCAGGQVSGSAASWPCGTRAVADASSCSSQPQLAGRCFKTGQQCGSPAPTGSGQACNLASPVCSTPGETCMLGRGVPKYGDYNGNACGSGRVFNIFVSGTSQPGATTAVGRNLFFAQSCVTSACPNSLSITKSAASSTVTAGTNLTYTIGVSNSGPGSGTNVTVKDTLPAGVTFVSSSVPCTLSAGVLTCNLGGLPSGVGVGFTVTIHVPSAGVGASTITNKATVSSDQPELTPIDNTSSVTTTVIFRADLSITKTAAPNPVAAGTTLTYTITVHNAGPSDASNVSVTDTLPTGVTFASGPCTGTTTLTCNVGTLVNAASKTIVVKVKIPHDFLSKMFVNSAIITNKATVSSTTTDPNLANNHVSLNTKVINVADLDIVGTVSPNPVHEGSIVTFTLTYNNIGPSDALQGFVLYYVPAGFTLVNHTGLPCAMGTGTVLCNLSPVTPAGYTQSFVLQLRVASNFLNPGETSRAVSNEFRISSTTADTDPGPALFVTSVVVVP